MDKTSYSADINGYYGTYGGAFIPELLYPNIEELRANYRKILEDPDFRKKYQALLRDYVGRPSALYYAENLSDHFRTRIYLKREDLNHTGAHKINNTVGQILLAEKLGKKRIIAETGAGQHGVATATVCALKKLECIVYMGETDMERQARNVFQMQLLGAKVIPVKTGNKTLKDATNEAIRDWINHPESHYIIGSVVGPHPYPDLVTRLQSVIGNELKTQLGEKINRNYPDHIIACIGGGSNAAGIFHPFYNQPEVRMYAVEAAGKGVHSGMTASTIQMGSEGILHGSRTLVMQNEDGQITEPYSISAGLDYPGIGPAYPHLFKTRRVQFTEATDKEALEAAKLCILKEGIIPALESAHALAALEKLNAEKDDVVVINLSGRGDKDIDTYKKHLNHE
ncbi:MAG: tryptophan synthase subunit beta [Bacteroidota bacterium]